MRKDFYREIRKSLGRFLSIFFIVALGVSLFVGIRATEPDMRLSGDAYVDENNLMDIKIMSTYGLTDEDVKAVEELSAIDKAVGTYSVDVLCQAEDSKQVLRVMAETKDMNLITVTDGRMPKEANECLMDKDFMEASGYKIGDTLKVESGTEDDLSETLETAEYKIVGSGSSPCFFALDRGSSTIGNGSVEGFLIVTPNAFVLDVYTEIYATVEGAKAAVSFTDEYENLIEDAMDQVEGMQGLRCEARRDDLKASAQSEIDEARNELNSKKAEAETEIAEYEKKLQDSQKELQSGRAAIASGRAELNAGKAQLEESKKQLAQMTGVLPQEQIQAMEAQIAATEKMLAESEAKLNSSEAEITKGEQELADGKTELAKAKQELQAQIADGEKEISDAEAEVEKIELPEWFIFDRSAIPEYTGYGDNADRIAALALVFPSIFFLVAALISLTTMTRMVEEQRVQIGTLKALGYSKGAIMGKYVGYALLATIGGSVLGWLGGEKLFPYIIIRAYKILYVNIPHIKVPYHLEYGLVATAIAVVCTVGATFMACYKELMAQPAVLMRPEAPKVGKRTWIERITIIWNHLNFSWKSSIRNLLRYKKRFLMTLIGIGGCMGLLIVGFGLRDSIMSVATKQYDELQTYEISVYLSDDITDENKMALEKSLDGNENVSGYTGVQMSSITTQYEEEKVDAYLTVIDDMEHTSDFFVYRSRTSKETYELSDEGIIISEKTAKMLGAKVGDKIQLSEEGKRAKEVRIDAICENYVGHYVYMTGKLYKEVYEEEMSCNSMLIKADVEKDELQKIGAEILEFDSILNVQYTEDLSAQLDGMLGALDQVIVVLIIVAGMLSFVVLYNLNNINITERRRELATLKVLGFHDAEVAMYVYRENIMLTLLGALVGCGIGKFLHYFTITTVEIDMAMFGREISVVSYLVSALFTIAFSVFVNWIMYFKLKKIDMVESLKSVE